MTGADPEILTLNGAGEIVPASLFLASPKGSVAYDNAATEMRPAARSCLQELNWQLRGNMRTAISLQRYARWAGKIPRESHFSLTPAARLSDEARDNPTVTLFGCSPSKVVMEDFSVEESVPQVDAMATPWRSAGYHVHQSYVHDAPLPQLTHVIDCTLGMVDVMMCSLAGFEEQSRVRRMELGYGRAGEHRTRTVGSSHVYEYRALSPWPLSTPMWAWWAHSVVRSVISRTYYSNITKTRIEALVEHLPKRSHVITIMDNCDAPGALEVWEAARQHVPRLLPVSFDSGSNGLSSQGFDHVSQAIRSGMGHRYLSRDLSLSRAWFVGHANRSRSQGPWMYAPLGVKVPYSRRRWRAHGGEYNNYQYFYSGIEQMRAHKLLPLSTAD